MKILAIDTSCDETAAAVTEGTQVLANVIWSQASMHAKFGGVMPSLAQRAHRERINWVIDKALRTARCAKADVGCVAVTTGPGLAIALEVGILKAKELALELRVPLAAVNHVEGHILSPLARRKSEAKKNMVEHFPVVGLVVSGGHTELVKVKSIGDYEILAATIDDALGEALDKAARMLGLGYPGGAILEKMAELGKPQAYPLPLPMTKPDSVLAFSYSGLKTAFLRKVAEVGQVRMGETADLEKQQIYDLAASFQQAAFRHLGRVLRKTLEGYPVKEMWVGGGVAANKQLRKQLRKLGGEFGIKIRLPYCLRLTGDNAAMIGVAAGFRAAELKHDVEAISKVDREPRARIDMVGRGET